MNIASLLAGDVLGEVGMQAASKLLEGVIKGNSNFSSIIDNLGNGDAKLDINDLNLSKEEELELDKIRALAMERGLSEIEVMIDGSEFKLDVKENTLTALVS